MKNTTAKILNRFGWQFSHNFRTARFRPEAHNLGRQIGNDSDFQILHNFRCWTTQIHHGEIEDNYKLLRFPDFGKLASRLVCPSLDFPRWSLPSPLVIPAWPDSRLGRTSHDVDGGGGGGVNVKAAKKMVALAEPIV